MLAANRGDLHDESSGHRPPRGAAFGRRRRCRAAVLRAQGEPIRIATLTPLTGAGGPYGPAMAKVAAAVVEEVNAAGGVLGRKVELVERGRPDQSRRRRARRAQADRRRQGVGDHGHLGLGGDDGGGAAVLGEQDLPLHRVGRRLDHPAAAPGLSDPHPAQHRAAGDARRRVPGRRSGPRRPTRWCRRRRSPSAASRSWARCARRPAARTAARSTTTRRRPTAPRSTRRCASEPDAIFCAGYTPDTIVLLKDLYRAGFKGKIIGQAYAINQKLIDQVGQTEVVEGVYTYAPSVAEGSGALERVKKMSGLGQSRPLHQPGLRPRQHGADGDGGRQGHDRHGDQGQHPQDQPRAAARRSTMRSTG